MPRPAPVPAAPPCPCGLPAAYADCCGRYHGAAGSPDVPPAPDALALMRSRYSAFVLGRTDVLRATWHPSTRPATLDPPPADLRWLGLEVRRHRAIDATHAEVEFVARSKQGGRAHRLHETSRFVHEADRWFYVDGTLHGGG